MNAPLYATGMISINTSLGLAIFLGILFGFFLQRGGLGNPHKLAGIFYLTDFTVPKVMFSAIVVAATGLYLLSDLGFIDLNKVWIVQTFFWPQIVGGLLFGIGFALSGYCPGTAVTGLGTGRLDALVVIVGIIAGSLLFAVLYPALESFYLGSPMGGMTLPKLLKVNHWLVLLFLYVLAGGLFYFLERPGVREKEGG